MRKLAKFSRETFESKGEFFHFSGEVLNPMRKSLSGRSMVGSEINNFGQKTPTCL